MRRLAFVVLAITALAGAGCAGLKELAGAAFERPRLSFRSVSVSGIDLEGATLAFDFRLENPNPYGVRLAKVAYGLDVEGQQVTRGEVAGGLDVPASGAAPVRFTARLRYADVPRFLEVVRTRDRVAYALQGSVGVDTPIGVVELPLGHDGEVALPRLPTLQLAGVSARVLSLTELELQVTLGVGNPNAFPIPAGTLGYALSVGGDAVARADGARIDGVPASGSGRLVLPVRLSLLGAGRAAATALRGGGVDVRLTGTAAFGPLRVPFDLSGRPSQAR
jgi:LEA14-like dessication related protein